MMKKISLLFLLCCVMADGKGTSLSPPGKPTITSCRSPEKETFTCWWRPGSNGGLPTTYALYYLRDNSDKVHECPDYHTAGVNSCFFNKNETSVWVNYNISVVATNKMGRTFSDPVDIDVAYIVQPHTPENVTVIVMEDKGWPFLRVSWESPHEADIRSGWLTLIYELRSKMEGEEEWEEHFPGQQKTFNLFSIRSGGTYHVQVRCKPDHGYWSEWTTTAEVKVSEYFFRERSLWVLIVVFTSFVFLIVTWIIYMNSRSLKHYILPPVPGPKIKGFDHRLLKQNNRDKDGLSVLMIPDFPLSSSNYEDLLVEYLEVFVPGEQGLSMEEGKEMQDSYFKSENSTSDNDSGRGSCDSHTLLIDKCKESKEDEQNVDSRNCGEILETSQNNWDEKAVRYHDSPDTCAGRVKTWPSVFTSLPQYTISPVQQNSSLEMVKQHCVSDTLYPSDSMSFSNCSELNSNDPCGPNYWEFGLNNMQPPQMHSQTCRQLQAHSNINIWKPADEVLQPFRSSEYVEVQKVNKEDVVLLQPVKSGKSNGKGCPHMLQGEDYSKVKGVDSENMLLLESTGNGMGAEMDRCFCEEKETKGLKESCYMVSPSATPAKYTITSMDHITMPVQDPKVLASSGYVDTATLFTMPVTLSAE